MPRSGRPVVVVTRPDAPDEAFAGVLASRGVAVEWVQTVAVVPPDEPEPLDAALAQLAAFDWVAFTSAHAVDAAVGHPRWRDAWQGGAGRTPRLAVVGPSTGARVAAWGYQPDLEAAEASGAGLAAALVAAHGGALPGVRILWPCSQIARPGFPDAVRAAGAALTPVVAYRTVPVPPAHVAALRDDLAAGVIDAVAFFSPSAAASLADALGTSGSLAALRGRTLVASLGPGTTAALHALGAPPDLEAHPHTAAALAASLAARLGS
jgi:uroporphyrinogen-III synthase